MRSILFLKNQRHIHQAILIRSLRIVLEISIVYEFAPAYYRLIEAQPTYIIQLTLKILLSDII